MQQLLHLVGISSFECVRMHGLANPKVITHTRKSTGTRHFCQILMQLKFSRQIFEESSNIKFHGNRSSGSELFYVNGLTHRPMGGQQTDMTKLRVTFHRFAIAPKLSLVCPTHSPPGCVLLPAAIFLNVKYSYKII